MHRAAQALFLIPLVSPVLAQSPTFEAPSPLLTKGGAIRVESPGYAFPVMHDLDGDGRKDLVVGQFRDGKMKVYKNLGKDGFGEGTWLEADGDVAKVPGVW